MVDKLLATGYVHVEGEEQAAVLYELYKDLMSKGHALCYSEETWQRKVRGASAYHYLTCVVCQPDRRIP